VDENAVREGEKVGATVSAVVADRGS